MEPHETDFQRARRQRTEVKKYGVTGSTPLKAAKKIKEHTSSHEKALGNVLKGENIEGKRERGPICADRFCKVESHKHSWMRK